MKLTSAWLTGLLMAGTTLFADDKVPAAPEPGHLVSPYYGSLSELPVGSIQPKGWIRQWLEQQAQGLTGHPENLSYPYDTCMFAGLIPPPPNPDKWWKEWWPYEQSAYYIDATTRLSWLINDPAISRRRDENINYILNYSTGTNLGGSKACWPNAVVGRALLAQFSATGDARVATTLQNWLLTSADAIASGGRNGANFEEAFYLYGLTGDPRLLQLASRVYNGYLQDTNSFCTVEKIESTAPFHEHGVTAAETLKCLPLMYAYTGDRMALRLAQEAYGKVLDHNLMADGGIVSSEHLEPVAFYSMHESCDITDWSWSLGYMFMATGDTRYADVVERATFNALPGAVTKDFKQLQYFSAVNQTLIAATNSHIARWPTRMTYRAAHDTECCAGNINRAMPNYVVRMWMRPADGGLAAVYYGPSEVTTTVHDQPISVSEETAYPFRDTILFRIKTNHPLAFNLQVRIPGWCDRPDLQLNGQPVNVLPVTNGFASINREFHDGDHVELKLPMPLHIENLFHDRSVCITRGPLVYSLKIDEKRIEHTQDAPNIKPFLLGHDIKGFPEVEFMPASDWRYGFDAALARQLDKIKVVESAMTDNPFLEDQTPVHLEVPLEHLSKWAQDGMKSGVIPGEPAGLPTGQQSVADSAPVMMSMVPYGATYLRLTTLPLISSRNLTAAVR